MKNDDKYRIEVEVRTVYLPDQSDPVTEQHVFAYTITLNNTGSVASQLVSRHWIITSGDGETKEVRGLGVVGEQPLLKPGEYFEYTSGTVISSIAGSMKGAYQMVAEDGFHFSVEIPEFILSVPRVLH